MQLLRQAADKQGMNGDDGGVTDKQPPDKVGGKDNQSASNRQQPLFILVSYI